MTRLRFPRGQQTLWIRKAIQTGKFSGAGISRVCGFNRRTFSGWLQESCTLPLKAAKLISTVAGLPIPTNAEHLDDYWNVAKSSRLGAKKRMELYGPPGTPAGRQKGGHISQLRRLEYPEKYSNCKIRKDYSWPDKSPELAELVGIILGDGSISHDQVKVTLNLIEEVSYIDYVTQLFFKLFRERPARYHYKGKNNNVCNLCLSGIKLVEFLGHLGLDRGNKVKRQASVPGWVVDNPKFSISTLRGLIDTDGGIFQHRHTVDGKKYFNIGLTFTSRSTPLLDFTRNTLLNNGFRAKKAGDGVYLYKRDEVIRYADNIGFSNIHHTERLKKLLQDQLTRKGVRVV